jgi:hypothetical protein
VFCPKCGKEFADQDAFCRYCGRALASGAAQTMPGITPVGIKSIYSGKVYQIFGFTIFVVCVIAGSGALIAANRTLGGVLLLTALSGAVLFVFGKLIAPA